VGYASAQKNIDKEIGASSFDQLRKNTSNEWQQKLAVVEVTDSNQQNKTVFYTALYHSLLIPWVIDDADGRYRGYDDKIIKKQVRINMVRFLPGIHSARCTLCLRCFTRISSRM
jgi:putative alpha-1,2-mannosidase